MNHITNPKTIKKLTITDAVSFATEYLPQLDNHTLEAFLGIVYIGGTHGVLTPQELVGKMKLTLRLYPQACPHSLLVVADLLEIVVDRKQSAFINTRPRQQLTTSITNTGRLMT